MAPLRDSTTSTGLLRRGGAREDDHPRLAVVGGTGAGAAGVEIALDEEPPRLGMRAEGDGRHLVAVGAGGNLPAHAFRQGAQAEVDEQVDGDVVARGGSGLLSGEHRARRDAGR